MRSTHNVPVDVPVLIVHPKRVLLGLLGTFLYQVLFRSELGDDSHTILGGCTPPLSKLGLPLVSLTLLF